MVSKVISFGTHRAVVINGNIAASAMSSASNVKSWFITPCSQTHHYNDAKVPEQKHKKYNCQKDQNVIFVLSQKAPLCQATIDPVVTCLSMLSLAAIEHDFVHAWQS